MPTGQHIPIGTDGKTGSQEGDRSTCGIQRIDPVKETVCVHGLSYLEVMEQLPSERAKTHPNAGSKSARNRASEIGKACEND